MGLPAVSSAPSGGLQSRGGMVPTACQDRAGLALGMPQAVPWPFPGIPPCSARLGKGKMKLLVCVHLEFEPKHLLPGRGWREGERAVMFLRQL